MRAMHITIAVQVRTFVNSLGAAFSRRSDEAQASNLAHQLSLNVFALEDALAHGRPYAAAASQVARSAPEDELVASACKALPEAAAERVSDLPGIYAWTTTRRCRASACRYSWLLSMTLSPQ